MSVSTQRSAWKVAAALAAAAAILAIAAVGIFELMHASGPGLPRPVAIAPARSLGPAALPTTQPITGLDQFPQPFRAAIQQQLTQQISQQLRRGGPMYNVIQWNLTVHQPGEHLAARWKHALSNGVVVELIAVGHPNENASHWWDGDGSPVATLPQWGDLVGERGYVLRISYPHAASKDASVLQRVNGDCNSIFNTDGEGNAEIDFSGAVSANDQPLRAEIGVGVGPWKPEQTSDAGKIEVQTLTPATASKAGQSLLTFHYTPSANVELAWAAVNSSGKIRWINSEGPISSRPAENLSLVEQDYLPLAGDRIRHIEVFSRPRVWTAFAGMADAPTKPHPATQPAVAVATPATAPANSRPPGDIQSLMTAFGNGHVVIHTDVEMGSTDQAVMANTQMQLAQSHLKQAAASAFGAVAGRQALRGICDPPPNLVLITGIAPNPGVPAHDTAIATLRLDGHTWNYQSLPPGIALPTVGISETPAERTAHLAARLDAIAEDVDAGNYQNAAGLRVALLRTLDRINAPPTTQPARK